MRKLLPSRRLDGLPLEAANHTGHARAAGFHILRLRRTRAPEVKGTQAHLSARKNATRHAKGLEISLQRAV